jgi:hypothetical protein
MTTLEDTQKENPDFVAASNTSFVTEKDGPKSGSHSEVFDDSAKENIDMINQNSESLHVEENAESDYPKTMKLATILVAVMLAVFLVALDMVSSILTT